MNVSISVIMSVYNEKAEWVQDSILSILNQTYRHLEFIIVLDNPMNHELQQLLLHYEKSDDRVQVLVNHENMGLVKSLNFALKHCSGEYVARMDADDVSVKDRLALQKEYLEQNGLDFLFSAVTIIDEESTIQYDTNKNEYNSVQTKKLLEIGNISKHPTWFGKREVYEELKGYRDVHYCEDYDFILRCLYKGYRIGKMGEALVRYRIRKSSISRSNSLEQFLNSRGLLRLYRKQLLLDEASVRNLMKSSKDRASDVEKEKFDLAQKKFSGATILIKQKSKLKGIFILINSLFLSKYFRSKMTDMMKYKFQESFVK
ncbi:glycosyltransferase [Cohnella caldifontis]|uniref:glycosyltransferase n=1 Tax=Cohnella caldifontis TaxID=3027471 RepID=UPI0023EB05A7|nr:glycosyltransferase [Cohnella sp. YIM B05605]